MNIDPKEKTWEMKVVFHNFLTYSDRPCMGTMELEHGWIFIGFRESSERKTTGPDLSPITCLASHISWCGHCDTICNFPLQTSWVYIFLSNWWWDNYNGDDNINDTTILHSFKSTRSETFWLHDFWSIHPLEFSGLENDWSDGLALVPLFIVGIWARFYWWSEIKHSRVHI